MTRKLKALGLGLVAAFALSAMIGINASAETGGHFVSEVEETRLHGTETATHKTHLSDLGSNIECVNATYEGTVQSATKTATEVKITPTYSTCRTQGSANHNVTVTMNGCYYLFTIGKKPTEVKQTVHFRCPVGKTAEVHHPNCTYSFHEQTPTGGVTYHNVLHGGKHAITATITVTGITVTRHGFCQLFGTEGHNAELTGNVTLTGFNVVGGAQVGITATG